MGCTHMLVGAVFRPNTHTPTPAVTATTETTITTTAAMNAIKYRYILH